MEKFIKTLFIITLAASCHQTFHATPTAKQLERIAYLMNNGPLEYHKKYGNEPATYSAQGVSPRSTPSPIQAISPISSITPPLSPTQAEQMNASVNAYLAQITRAASVPLTRHTPSPALTPIHEHQ